MSTTLHVAPTVKTTLNTTSFFVEMQRRAALANERSRLLRSQAKRIKEEHKRLRRPIFNDRAFHRLSSTLTDKRHRLLIAIWQESSRRKSPKEKLREAIFLEKLHTPEITLENLENRSS